ncbi:MAG TPA: DUF502 domain-containing protein, partial [Methylomirabilota bacterium]|nr:DUF502 domain-containing protein [Methylomirabilota bacterium]
IVLIAIAFAAGVFARTALGGRTFAKLEGAVLARVPVYTVFRQTIGDMAGSSALMSSGEATKVVLVRLDDMTVIGFQIERRADGLTVVFLPGAPSALSGSVALVDHDRVTPIDLTPTDIMDRMRRLGSGLGNIAGGRAG